MNGYASTSKSPDLNDEVSLIAKDGTSTAVYCGRISVTASTFYGYGDKSLRPDVILVMHTEEYTGEEYMDFYGKKYAITRVYERTDGYIELTGTRKLGVR